MKRNLVPNGDGGSLGTVPKKWEEVHADDVYVTTEIYVGGVPASGDMKTTTYDTGVTGRVDKAESVDDGTNSKTALQIKTHLDDESEKHRIINDGGSGALELRSASNINGHQTSSAIHRSINDGGSGATDLWSASKIITELATKSDNHSHPYEPSFSKNTAFNKDFGSAAGTTSEGDHDHPNTDIHSSTETQTGSIGAATFQEISFVGGNWTLGWSIGTNTAISQAGFFKLSGHDDATYAAKIGIVNEPGTTTKQWYFSARYLTASPPYVLGATIWNHFLFILRDIETKEMVRAAEATDPTWQYNGNPNFEKDSKEKISSFPHPFFQYHSKDPKEDGLEIILVDLQNFDLESWKTEQQLDWPNGKKSILDDLSNIMPNSVEKSWEDYGLTETIPGFTDVVKVVSRT